MSDIATQAAAVDAYLDEHLFGHDPVLDAALEDSRAAGLPAIQVPANTGKLLSLLVRLHRASNVLEIGTLAGYSTIWLARALPPGGRLVTLEFDPSMPTSPARNLTRAGVADRVDLRVGRRSIARRARARGRRPVRSDLHRRRQAPHLRNTSTRAALSRPGTLIVVDNVVRNGGWRTRVDRPNVQRDAARHRIARQPSRVLDATVLQTVGAKGYDGFALALVL